MSASPSLIRLSVLPPRGLLLHAGAFRHAGFVCRSPIAMSLVPSLMTQGRMQHASLASVWSDPPMESDMGAANPIREMQLPAVRDSGRNLRSVPPAALATVFVGTVRSGAGLIEKGSYMHRHCGQ